MFDYAQNPGREAELVLGFLAGDEEARDALPHELGERLLWAVGRVAPDLVRRGLREDVVQQMYLLLLKRSGDHYDPDRGTAWRYLETMLRLAARDVRSEAALAGEARRPARDETGEFPDTPPPLPLQEVPEPRDGSELPEDQVLARAAVRALAGTVPDEAPSWTGPAVTLLSEDRTITEAAGLLGITRFTLRRALTRWVVPQGDAMLRD